MFVYLLAFGLPFWAVYNCSGWGTDTMEVDNCYIDTPFLREIANDGYSVLFISSFIGGAPIILYILTVLLFTETPIFIAWVIRKYKKK